jgi:hypothetical protein
MCVLPANFGSKELFRVNRRGFLDMFVASVTGMRPYFCDRCGRKSYRRPGHASLKPPVSDTTRSSPKP